MYEFWRHLVGWRKRDWHEMRRRRSWCLSVSLGPTKSPVVLIRAHLSIVRAASSRSTNLSQSPAELKLQNEFCRTLFFPKRDFFFFGFFKDSWQGPNYSRFFNWKTGISKALREKWRFLSTPSWRRVSLHKRPPPATSPPTLQVLKHLALLKRKRQHYHHQRFQAR